MEKSPGEQNTTVSLPKGGGAIRGLGEKFSADAHTGTGTLTVAIPVPPGRNGFQPELSLTYSSGNGGGLFGLGWALTTGGVSRKTSRGVPQYRDAEDTFVINGLEDLVLVGDQPGVSRYQPRTEGGFARILRYRDAADDYWEMRSGSGLTTLFGTPGARGRDPAVIADPERPDQVFCWKQTATIDPFGNRIEFLYDKDHPSEDGAHRWDQCYLSEVRYVDYGEVGDRQFLIRVQFEYEPRPDPFSTYRSGFEIRTVRRCRSIQAMSYAGEERLVGGLALDYEPGEAQHHSMLRRIQWFGRDGDETERFAPLEFEYSGFAPRATRFIRLSGPVLPDVSLAEKNLELGDFAGQALPGFIQVDGAVRIWKNRGGGRFDAPVEVREAPAGIALGERGVFLADANGNGSLDLVVMDEGQAGYYPARFGALWESGSFRPWASAPSFPLDDTDTRFLDLNGDGVADAVRCAGERLECYFNDATRGWSGSRFIARADLEHFPDVPFSDPGVRWADLSGDGLSDLVFAGDGAVEYWPALGWGRWSRRVIMRNGPRLPWNYDPNDS